jgi:hypothetical protein
VSEFVGFFAPVFIIYMLNHPTQPLKVIHSSIVPKTTALARLIN